MSTMRHVDFNLQSGCVPLLQVPVPYRRGSPRRSRQERLPSGTFESDLRSEGGVNERITGPAGTSRGTSMTSLWLSGTSVICVMVME